MWSRQPDFYGPREEEFVKGFTKSTKIKLEPIIELNLKSSRAAESKINEKIYATHLKISGEPESYNLEGSQLKGYTFIPNHQYLDKQKKVTPKKAIKSRFTYNYVIIPNAQGEPSLRIGVPGNHYFLAGKAKKVYAAGEIFFEDGRIVKINPEAGGYHIKLKTDEEKENFYEYIKRVFLAVNLPFDKFITHDQVVEEDRAKALAAIVEEQTKPDIVLPSNRVAKAKPKALAAVVEEQTKPDIVLPSNRVKGKVAVVEEQTKPDEPIVLPSNRVKGKAAVVEEQTKPDEPVVLPSSKVKGQQLHAKETLNNPNSFFTPRNASLLVGAGVIVLATLNYMIPKNNS